MAEGVSHSSDCKAGANNQSGDLPADFVETFSDTLLCLEELSGALYELLAQRNTTRMKIFSLSPGSDVMRTTHIYETLNSRSVSLGAHHSPHNASDLQKLLVTCSAGDIDRAHLCCRVHRARPH